MTPHSEPLSRAAFLPRSGLVHRTPCASLPFLSLRPFPQVLALPGGLEQAALQASSRAGYGQLSAEEQAAKTIEDKVKARLKKDPDAPKKPMSAYIAFAAKRRCATRPPSPTPAGTGQVLG